MFPPPNAARINKAKSTIDKAKQIRDQDGANLAALEAVNADAAAAAKQGANLLEQALKGKSPEVKRLAAAVHKDTARRVCDIDEEMEQLRAVYDELKKEKSRREDMKKKAAMKKVFPGRPESWYDEQLAENKKIEEEVVVVIDDDASGEAGKPPWGWTQRPVQRGEGG